MIRTLYTSVDEMLAPETFSELIGRPVTKVHHSPAEFGGYSGSPLLTVRTDQEDEPRYVLKRLSREWDWKMRVTDDFHCREVALWQYGLMDLLPPEVGHAIIFAEFNGMVV